MEQRNRITFQKEVYEVNLRHPDFTQNFERCISQLSSSMTASTYGDPVLPDMSWDHLLTQQTLFLLQI
jgi:hypothetical protein